MRSASTSTLSKFLMLVAAAVLLAVAAVALSSCAAPNPENAPADNSAPASSGGLACFSAILPASDENDAAAVGTCNALCASRDAACVGAALEDHQIILPMPTCGDAASLTPSSPALACRCCRVSQ
jgi:hypothetical protein